MTNLDSFATLSLVAALAGCGPMLSSIANRGDATQPKTTMLAPGDSGYVDPGPFDGPLAEKYAGKIVFSSAPIDYRDSDDSAVYQTYRLGDPLYIRLWSKESAHNLRPTCTQHRISVKAYVNEAAEPIYFSGFELGGRLKRTRGAASLSLELDRPFTSKVIFEGERLQKSDPVLAFNTKVVGALVDGTSSLRVVATVDCGSTDRTDPVYAEGTIPVIAARGAIRAYQQAYGPHLAPSPHHENAKLVPQILAAMKTVPTWETEHLLAARVISDDWQPIRHEYTGVLVAKQISAALIVRAKSEQDPEKCRLFDMRFRRDAEGGKLYHAGTGHMLAFPCSNAPSR